MQFLRGSSSFSYLIPYYHSVYCFAHGHTGVLHKTSWDINYWHKHLLKYSPAYIFVLAWLFANLCYTSLPKNVPFFCRTIILRIPFPALCYCIYLLITLCQLRMPLPPFWERATAIYEGRQDRSLIWITTVYNSPNLNNSPLTFKFAIVRSFHGWKRKLIRMILTPLFFTNFNNLNNILTKIVSQFWFSIQNLNLKMWLDGHHFQRKESYWLLFGQFCQINPMCLKSESDSSD